MRNDISNTEPEWPRDHSSNGIPSTSVREADGNNPVQLDRLSVPTLRGIPACTKGARNGR